MHPRRPWRQALLLSLAMLPLLALADPPLADPAAYARGEKLYERCAACHAIAFDRTGPRHCGLLGRRAGSLPGFAYSPAMRHSGIVWTAASLDRFLRAPLAAVPGTSMGYDGIKDAGERHDLIYYLSEAGQAAKCRPERGVSR